MGNQIEYNAETPREIREKIDSVLRFTNVPNLSAALLAATMENLYFVGKLHGTVETQERNRKIIENLGRSSVL